MRVVERAVTQAVGTILFHNVAGADGIRLLKKGVLLGEKEVTLLSEAGCQSVEVAVLEPDDVHEDEAAQILAETMQTEELLLSRPVGGRVNLKARTDGLLQVDVGRLLALNMLPGITLATRSQHMVVGPNQATDSVGTLKIVPFAIPRELLDRGVTLADDRPGIIEIRPFPPGRRAALLLVGAPAVHGKLLAAYEPPTRTRLESLGTELAEVTYSIEEEAAICQAAARLAETFNLLIIAGQTSVMDEEDTTLRALRAAGADMTLSGAPVDPGNLLALAYLAGTPVLCAPGCARGLRRNVVDLVLPRLLLGDRLGRREIAELGLGGFLTAEERNA